MNNLSRLGFLIIMAAIATCGAFAQSKDTGAIEGNILDAEGMGLPGVEVKLSSPDMIGGIQSKVCDEQGKFRFVGLMPGTYTVEATLQGFVPAKREGIRLHMGQTLTLTLNLGIAALESEVTVLGIAPLIDVRDSAVATTTLDTDFLTNVPNAGRRTSGMVNQAAGVWQDQGFGGRSRTGNSYTVDGVETRYPRTGEDWSMVDFNIFQEMQVLGLGAAAEHDGFSGIVQNSITKSGGNTVHGHAEFVFMDWAWQAKNFDPNDKIYSLYSAPPRRKDMIGAFSMGGPILKDKMWFFLALKHSSAQREIAGMTEVSNLLQPTGFLKITYQPSSRFRVSGFFEADYYINAHYGLSITRPPETTEDNVGPTYMFNLSGMYSFTDSTFLELKALGYWAPQVLDPQKGMDISGREDDRTGMYSVNTPSYYDSEADRYQIGATVSHHAEDFVMGSHDFKFGADYENLPAFDEYGYVNGIFYRDNVFNPVDRQYHNYAYTYMYRTEVKGQRYSAFVQDSWRISDRLTVNPGIRFNTHRGQLSRLDQTVLKTSNVVPRIGLTWDVFGNHSTALKVHFGRYSDGMKNNYYQRADPGQEDWVQYEILPDGQRVEVYRLKLSNPAVIDPDLKHPVLDQFTLGIERELARDLSLSATFVQREWKNLTARVNTGATWVTQPFTFVDNDGAARTIEVYRKTSPSSADAFMITNAAAGKYSVIVDQYSKYWGLMFSLTKRFSNNWMLIASYMYSELKGTEQGGSTGSEQSQPPWLDPNLQINLDGRLDGDFTHQIKLYSTIFLPFDIVVSPSFQYVTGRPWSRQIRVPVSGSPTIKIEPQSSKQRLDPLINFDLRLEKDIRIKGSRVGLQLDVFNLFNRGYATGIRMRIDQPTQFGLASGVNSGRQIRLGIRFLY